jgi:hypothetical protein
MAGPARSRPRNWVTPLSRPSDHEAVQNGHLAVQFLSRSTCFPPSALPGRSASSCGATVQCSISLGRPQFLHRSAPDSTQPGKSLPQPFVTAPSDGHFAQLRDHWAEEEAEAECAWRTMTVQFCFPSPCPMMKRKAGLDRIFWQRFRQAMRNAPASWDLDAIEQAVLRLVKHKDRDW